MPATVLLLLLALALKPSVSVPLLTPFGYTNSSPSSDRSSGTPYSSALPSPTSDRTSGTPSSGLEFFSPVQSPGSASRTHHPATPRRTGYMTPQRNAMRLLMLPYGPGLPGFLAQSPVVSPTFVVPSPTKDLPKVLAQLTPFEPQEGARQPLTPRKTRPNEAQHSKPAQSNTQPGKARSSEQASHVQPKGGKRRTRSDKEMSTLYQRRLANHKAKLEAIDRALLAPLDEVRTVNSPTGGVELVPDPQGVTNRQFLHACRNDGALQRQREAITLLQERAQQSKETVKAQEAVQELSKTAIEARKRRLSRMYPYQRARLMPPDDKFCVVDGWTKSLVPHKSGITNREYLQSYHMRSNQRCKTNRKRRQILKLFEKVSPLKPSPAQSQAWPRHAESPDGNPASAQSSDHESLSPSSSEDAV